MDEKKAIKTLVEAAKLYELNYVNKNMLVVFKEKNLISHIELLFLPDNFLHLTGVKITGKNASYFYKKCLNNELSKKDIAFKTDGTTVIKLKVLCKMMTIGCFSNMIGDYKAGTTKLLTQKVCGNTHVCMGFIRVGNYYVPNTLLEKDIRDIIYKQHQILAVFSKTTQESSYSNLEYQSRTINIDYILKEEKIKKMLHDTLINNIK